jgi:hypothetical protein
MACPHCRKDTCEHWLCSQNDDIVQLMAQTYAKNADLRKVEENRHIWEAEIHKWAVPRNGGWYTRTPDAPGMKRRLQQTTAALAMFVGK